jgi:hypothetical protein
VIGVMILIGVVAIVIYIVGVSDGKDKVRDEIEKALTGKRKGRK